MSMFRNLLTLQLTLFCQSSLFFNISLNALYHPNIPRSPHVQHHAANMQASDNPALPSHSLNNSNHLIPIGQERLQGNIFNIVSYNNPELGCIPKWLKLYITVRNKSRASSPTTGVPETDSVDNTRYLVDDLRDMSEDDFELRHSRQSSQYLYEKLDMILSQETSSQADINHLPYALEVINKVESAEKREVFRRYQQLMADLKKVHCGF